MHDHGEEATPMDIRDDLKAFIDDELSPERAAEVQAAIDRDPELRQEYAFMKLLSGEIKDSAREPVIKGLDQAVARAAQPKRSFFPLKPVGLVAGGVAGLFLIGLVGSLVFPVFPEAKVASKRSQDQVNWAAGGAAETTASPANVGGGLTTESEQAVAPESSVDGTATFGKKHNLAEATRSSADSLAVKDAKSYAQPESAPRELVRKVIRNADMAVKVKNVRESVAKASNQISAVGGIVENTNYNGDESTSTATMQFQVPESKFTATVDYLRELGTVTRENVGGQDVTAEVADTDGRVKALADEEYNLIAELQRARNSETRLEIRRRLSDVRQQIQGLKEQNKVMKGLASMSRVSLTLNQSGKLDEDRPSDWFNQTWSGATGVLGFFGRVIGFGAIYVIALSPIWLPIVLIVKYLKKRNQIND